MDGRYIYAASKVKNRNSRILEIGPLNRPIFTKCQYANCFYCDIRSTEAVKALYTGNAYLDATGISININTIVDIDFVLNGNYSETFANIEKFDYVVVSHVIEHVDDILYFFNDIASVLKPGGSLIIVYPDKRYCFDHYRQEASFRDAFEVSQKGYKANGRMVFDFLFNAIQENSEPFFWRANHMEDHMPVNSFEAAKAAYNRIMDGSHEDDVHYWPFSDIGFLKFLYDCTRAGLLKFTCTDFVPTAENTQQFFVTLRYDETVPENIEKELVNLRSMIANAPIDYRNSGQLRIEEQNNFLLQEREALQSQAKAAINKSEELLRQVDELQTLIESKNQQYIESQSRLLTVEEYSHQLELDLSMQRERAETNAKIVDELKAQIAMILTSSSWKITAPARRLVDIIRKR